MSTKTALPKISLMSCAPWPTVRRMLSGSPWAALPRCTSAFATRKLARSLTIAGVGYGAKPDQQPEYGNSMRREADHAEAIGMTALPESLLQAVTRNACAPRTRPAGAALRRSLVEHSVAGMAMTLRGVLAARPSLWHLADASRELRVPVLLLTGDDDTPCLEPNLFLKATLPEAALCVLPRTGHLIEFEEPTLFNTIVFGFLAAVDRGQWSGGRAPPKISPQQREPQHEQYWKIGGQGRAGDRGKPRPGPRHC